MFHWKETAWIKHCESPQGETVVRVLQALSSVSSVLSGGQIGVFWLSSTERLTACLPLILRLTFPTLRLMLIYTKPSTNHLCLIGISLRCWRLSKCRVSFGDVLVFDSAGRRKVTAPLPSLLLSALFIPRQLLKLCVFCSFDIFGGFYWFVGPALKFMCFLKKINQDAMSGSHHTHPSY